jgi:ring-1,2-phenylacetyl-CoA epoxidase subunit PaaC
MASTDIALTADPDPLFEYILRLGDNSLVLGHRLGEWCAHGPELEVEIALLNVGLDLIGQARLLLTYAGEVEGTGQDEDALAYLRDAEGFRNLLLVEQPNGDFAVTIVRQFLYDAFNLEFYTQLQHSSDARLAAIATKVVKEITYHFRFSAGWVVRLGDGTAKSQRRTQTALDELWRYTGEMFAVDDIDQVVVAAGIGVDRAALKPLWDQRVVDVLAEATLIRPDDNEFAIGGITGDHGEGLSHMLADMQILPRTHPDATW